MQLIQLIVCILALVEKICFAELIIETSKLDESLADASIDILESCHIDRVSTVGFAGSSIESIIEKISLRDDVMPVTLIKETPNGVSNEPLDRAPPYKLQVFVVTATNPDNLVRTLTRVKNTKWWNHMASFLLIDLADAENECSNAREMLWEAWKMDLLNSKFMCRHRTQGTLIYTFNPYTSIAPIPWRQENTYKGINDHVWTLFVQEYREDEAHCDALDFDKTLDLGGYEIRASVRGMDLWPYANSTMGLTLFNRLQHIKAQILLTSLNATWKFRKHPEAYVALWDNNGNPIGVAAETINGTSDICLNILPQHIWMKFKMAYPHLPADVAVTTQYTGHKSQLDKIISVLDRESRFGVFVVLVITLLFFKYYQRQPLIRSFLELVLIICNAGISKIPTKSAPRIYLASLFILVVTFQGIYQSDLAAILTTPVRLPTVDSMEDLARSDHMIYGPRFFESFFNQSAFKGRFVGSLQLNCIEDVLRDPRAACVQAKLAASEFAMRFNLHVSKESMGTIFWAYLIRPDWPLEDRVNEIYGRAVASDLLRPQYIEQLDSIMRKLKAYEDEDKDQAARILTLEDLSFAFVILAIGLGCATITFIIEVATFKKAVAKPRSRIRRRIRFVE